MTKIDLEARLELIVEELMLSSQKHRENIFALSMAKLKAKKDIIDLMQDHLKDVKEAILNEQ